MQTTDPELKLALDQARHLAENGVPICVARPFLRDGEWVPDGGHGGTGYLLPPGWHHSPADPAVVDTWQPGDALLAVMGHQIDLLDVDPHKGGTGSLERIRAAGMQPVSYGHAATPSGGDHYFVMALGVRSLDGVLPGIDVKAGDASGHGRGFAFIAPTVKRSKTTGELVPYRWIDPPDLTHIALVGWDDSGAKLAAMVASRGERGAPAAEPYDGPQFDALSTAQRQWATTYAESVLARWHDLLAEAQDWPEGQTDAQGRGWEKLARDAAWACARLAASPWTPTTPQQARDAYHEMLPPAIAQNAKCRGKWADDLIDKAGKKPPDSPPWSDFDTGTVDVSGLAAKVEDAKSWPAVPTLLDDAHMCEWLSFKGLQGEWCWATKELGWMHWNGRIWERKTEEDLYEAVRQVMLDVNITALQEGASATRMAEIHKLLSRGRIVPIILYMRGVVTARPAEFNRRADLLAVGNGVVDLRTGDLLPYDRSWMLTSITETPYKPGATHKDWNQALTAMEPEVADWMQLRVGQAATGYMTSDDVLPICQGAGKNGKTTWLTALHTALGSHMVNVPYKLLVANPNDHPTELMTLYGARMAVVDETPEEGQLNVPRLKMVLGTPKITARMMHKDFVTWDATHSLFVITNYVPQISQTDLGTWRRLALVKFDKTFKKDDRFRVRLQRGDDGIKEAVLAWVVDGARRWYEAQRCLPEAPEKVARDTEEWRKGTDLMLGYIKERIVFDPDACVMTRDLLEDVNDWLRSNGNRPWSDRLLAARFAQHEQVMARDVERRQVRNPKGLVPRFGGTEVVSQPQVWLGIRWRTDAD